MRQMLFAALSTVALAWIFALPGLVHAEGLYFEKVAVKTSSEKTCLRFAGDVARGQGFRNTHSSASEVAGEKDGAYVAITCVGRGNQPAIAVVMSMAPTFNTAKQVGHVVAERIKGITCIDSPC